MKVKAIFEGIAEFQYSCSEFLNFSLRAGSYYVDLIGTQRVDNCICYPCEFWITTRWCCYNRLSVCQRHVSLRYIVRMDVCLLVAFVTIKIESPLFTAVVTTLCYNAWIHCSWNFCGVLFVGHDPTCSKSESLWTTLLCYRLTSEEWVTDDITDTFSFGVGLIAGFRSPLSFITFEFSNCLLCLRGHLFRLRLLVVVTSFERNKTLLIFSLVFLNLI